MPAKKTKIISKRKSNKISEDLKSIYKENGKMPDLSKLEKNEKSRFRRFLVTTIILLLFLSGVAWGGFFLWTQGLFQNGQFLSASIEGQKIIKSGEEVLFTIKYENTSDVPLAALNMKLSLPLGFTILEANPKATEGQNWTIGSLTPGSDGQITIKGIIRAEIPSSSTIQALFTYRPANFSSDFEDIETFSIDVDQSVLLIDITGPEKALAGDEISYIINLQNNSSLVVESIQVSAELPEDFVFASSDTAPTSPETAEWIIPSLAPDELYAITLNGSYTGSADADQKITAHVGLLEGGGVILLQNKTETVTDVLGGNIVFHLIVDGSSEDIKVDLGENLLVSIDYTNNGNEVVEDLSFTLTLEGANGKRTPIDWEKAGLEENHRQGNEVSWNKERIEALETVNPKDDGVIDITFPIREAIDTNEISDSFTMKLRADLAKVGSIESPRSIETSPINISLNSDLKSNALARYHSNEDIVGSGPLPPTVGETTTYQIVWSLENSLHALENVRFSSNLPADVSFTGAIESDIGEIKYNDTTRLITWTVSKLPTSIKKATAKFSVAITPDENEVGTFVKLINATSVDAEDTVTKDHLSRAHDILTTELIGDEKASGKGVILEE